MKNLAIFTNALESGKQPDATLIGPTEGNHDKNMETRPQRGESVRTPEAQDPAAKERSGCCSAAGRAEDSEAARGLSGLGRAIGNMVP